MRKDQGSARLTRDRIFIRRDESGKVVPIEVPLLFMKATVLMRPVTLGTLRSMDPELLTKPATDWPLEDQINLLKEHLVDPDLSDLTVEKAQQDLDSWTLEQLVSAVVAYSGPLRGRNQVQQVQGKEEGADVPS